MMGFVFFNLKSDELMSSDSCLLPFSLTDGPFWWNSLPLYLDLSSVVIYEPTDVIVRGIVLEIFCLRRDSRGKIEEGNEEGRRRRPSTLLNTQFGWGSCSEWITTFAAVLLPFALRPPWHNSCLLTKSLSVYQTWACLKTQYLYSSSFGVPNRGRASSSVLGTFWKEGIFSCSGFLIDNFILHPV